MTYGFIGTGNMGGALARALVREDDRLGQSAGFTPSCVTPLWFVPQ